MSVTRPVVREKVYDAWNCEARAETAHELRLKRVIRGITLVGEDGDTRVAEHAVGSERRPRRRTASRVDEIQPVGNAVAVVIARWNLVHIEREQQIVALAPDVADFERGVAHDLVLRGDVPLPVVAHVSGRIQAVLRDAVVGGESVREWFRVAVERAASDEHPVERRIEAEVQPVLQRLALIELAEAGAQGCLAVPFHVPRHAESRLEVVQGLGERPIGPVRSAKQARILAGRRARRQQHAVARVGAKRRH